MDKNMKSEFLDIDYELILRCEVIELNVNSI